MFFYPMNVGRNTDEIIRTITALQTADANHVMTPADWRAGNDVFIPYLNEKDEKQVSDNKSDDIYKVTWFMTYKKLTGNK
jgi:peroxiredoxin (alkyl hydroperoxide reductase subunit C)